MANPYDVERSWPDYFLEHRERTVEQAGTYRCGDLPVWTVYCPKGYLGHSTIIEGDDGLVVYDTGVNTDAGAVHGASAIVDPSDVASGAVDIYAWHNSKAERANKFGEILNRQIMGVAYYGGAFLSPEDRHHHGIGVVPAGGAAGFIPPTALLWDQSVRLINKGSTPVELQHALTDLPQGTR